MSDIARIDGIRRVEQDRAGGWIARDQTGGEIGGKGWRWNSRSVARTAALESDIFGPFATLAQKDTQNG